MTDLYPINGYAPGNYSNICFECQEEFTGDKRAISCESCAMGRLVEDAERFAREKHAGQAYGDQPYIEGHVLNVVKVLRQFDLDEFYRAAGWLHDVIEDTDATKEQIEQLFGRRVAALVWACTGVGKNRRERNASIYRKIKECPDAAIVKVADRIANVEASDPDSSHRQMYVAERETFQELVGQYAPRSMIVRLEAAYSGR